ncbi:MAG: hypothetical protein R6V25_00185 [Desulfatiglandales bacterium]
MEESGQGRAAFLSKRKDMAGEPGLRSELVLVNAVFEAARMGRSGETFAMRIALMWKRLVSPGPWSERERPSPFRG